MCPQSLLYYEHCSSAAKCPFYERKEEEMEKEYQFLCEFTQNTHPSKRHLIKRYGEQSFNEAVEQSLIGQVGVNDFKDPVFAITQLGIKRRDR